MLPVRISSQPLFDDAEERIQSAEVFHPVDHWLPPWMPDGRWYRLHDQRSA